MCKISTAIICISGSVTEMCADNKATCSQIHHFSTICNRMITAKIAKTVLKSPNFEVNDLNHDVTQISDRKKYVRIW